MSLAQYLAGREVEVKTFYYSGTNTLANGEALCYENVAITTNATYDNTQGTTAFANTPGPLTGINQVGRNVTDPATAILASFAGIVSPSSDGKVGPCYVDLIVPRSGDVVQCKLASGAWVVGATLNVTNGSRLLSTVADSTFNIAWVGTVAATIDTSVVTDANNLVPVRFK